MSFETDVYYRKDDERKVLLSKHKDYGPKNIAESPGGALNGLRVRLHDKLARVNNLLDSGADPHHEGLIDTALDIANYGTIMALVLAGEWPGVEGESGPVDSPDDEPTPPAHPRGVYDHDLRAPSLAKQGVKAYGVRAPRPETDPRTLYEVALGWDPEDNGPPRPRRYPLDPPAIRDSYLRGHLADDVRHR